MCTKGIRLKNNAIDGQTRIHSLRIRYDTMHNASGLFDRFFCLQQQLLMQPTSTVIRAHLKYCFRSPLPGNVLLV